MSHNAGYTFLSRCIVKSKVPPRAQNYRRCLRSRSIEATDCTFNYTLALVGLCTFLKSYTAKAPGTPAPTPDPNKPAADACSNSPLLVAGPVEKKSSFFPFCLVPLDEWLWLWQAGWLLLLLFLLLGLWRPTYFLLPARPCSPFYQSRMLPSFDAPSLQESISLASRSCKFPKTRRTSRREVLDSPQLRDRRILSSSAAACKCSTSVASLVLSLVPASAWAPLAQPSQKRRIECKQQLEADVQQSSLSVLSVLRPRVDQAHMATSENVFRVLSYSQPLTGLILTTEITCLSSDWES